MSGSGVQAIGSKPTNSEKLHGGSVSRREIGFRV